jgi:outer membrane receptor for ferrienterochelin and colicin
VSFQVKPEESNIDLFDLSLEELLDIKLSTGSLKQTDTKESASAITLIRQEQIKYSSAKNVTSLLEIYVPGLLIMAHSEGDKIGLRGHIAAENYKLLLLVNGKNITNIVYEGAITELDQWELHDIEKIEVIRGPGSVTYGSGAIAGVINIITKSAKGNHPKLEVNLSANDIYRSKGGSLQYTKKTNELSLYSFASYRETNGYENPDYFVLAYQKNNDNRYLGQQLEDLYPPQDYLADTFSKPQVKIHIDVDYGNNLNIWTRYTQSGQSHHFVAKTPVMVNGNEKVVNGRQVELSSFMGSVNHNYDFSKTSKITSSITYDNQEYIRWNRQNVTSEWEHQDNIKDYAFSQERYVASVLYNYSGITDVNLITGFEYNNTNARAPWHKSRDHLWIREGVHLMSDFSSSVYTQDLSLNGRPSEERSVAIGSGIKMSTYTHLLEVSYQISEKNKVMYSHRLDSPDISATMYSPRLSLVSKINNDNTVVITAQRALRMMPLRAQYLYDTSNQSSGNSEHESIDGLEISYFNQSINSTSLNFRAFYNDIHAVGFTGEDLQFLGDITLMGIDFELNYKYKNIDFILNHSFINALDIEMNDALKTGSNRNNISFSDYYYKTKSDIPLTLEGYGDGLNNVPENVTKLIFTAKFLDNKLVMQINAQLYWSYDGSYDEMKMYQRAYDNFDLATLSIDEKVTFKDQKMEFENERRLLDENDGYDFDYSVNVSATYHWLYKDETKMNISIFVDNITNSKNIYYVSTGSSRSYPERLKYLEQPTTIGLNFSVSY